MKQGRWIHGNIENMHVISVPSSEFNLGCYGERHCDWCGHTNTWKQKSGSGDNSRITLARLIKLGIWEEGHMVNMHVVSCVFFSPDQYFGCYGSRK